MTILRRLASFAAVALLAAACQPTGSGPSPSPAPSGTVDPGAYIQRDAFQAADQVFVRSAWQEMTVVDPAATAPPAREMVRAAGGRLESETDEQERVTMVVRVPEASLDSVLARLGTLGKVNERRVAAQDVTDQSVDLDARLRNLTAARDRLRQHLGASGSVQDVVAIERELARLQSEIDVLEATRRRLQTDVALSRVTLTLNRKHVLGPLGVLLAGIGKVIGKLFVIR
jgi:hypothetical protein